MGYDRTFRLEEIHQMLYLSERRLRPTSPAARAHPGHAITQHTEQRDDPFDRRHIRQDSTFSTRKDLVLAVHEALHDPAGQRELAGLNSRSVHTCSITVQLSAMLGKIKANVVQNPMARIGNRVLPAHGPQNYLAHALVSSVFVLVDKVGPWESWAPLHIQTAYPKDIVP